MQGFLLFPELNKTYTTGTFHASILHNHNIYNCTRPDIDLVQSISRKKKQDRFSTFSKEKGRVCRARSDRTKETKIRVCYYLATTNYTRMRSARSPILRNPDRVKQYLTLQVKSMKKPEEQIKNTDAKGRFQFLRLISNIYIHIRQFQLILGTL